MLPKTILRALIASIATLIMSINLQAAPSGNDDIETRIEDGCTIHKRTVHSESMNRDIRVVIVLPPSYDKDRAKGFPTLHTLHGMGAPYETWSHMDTLRKSLKDMPMVVTCFDADEASWYIDSTEKPDSQFRTFFFDEFLPWVAKNYNVSRERAVTGFSMGGFGAMSYAFDRPDLFTSASALSGAFYPLETGKAPTRISDAFKPILGNYEQNAAAYAERDLYNRLEGQVAAQQHIPPLMLRCGTEEMLLHINRGFVDFIVKLNADTRKRLEPQVANIESKRDRRKALYALLDKEAIDFTYVESSGEHNWSYWKSQAADIAAFHWKHFNTKE